MESLLDLTDRYPTKYDLPRMREELLRLEESQWVRH